MLLECQPCGAVVDAISITHYKRALPGEYPDSVHLYRCPRCLNPILVEVDDVIGDGDQFIVLYPPAPKVGASVPIGIRQAFEEAASCLRAKAFTAASIMCRKTLDGICEAHGVKKANLVNGLKELRERGIIESNLFEWANELRIHGNEAAHDVTITTTPQDARDVVEFTHALLEYIFTFKEKFDAFKQRRTASKREHS